MLKKDMKKMMMEDKKPLMSKMMPKIDDMMEGKEMQKVTIMSDSKEGLIEGAKKVPEVLSKSEKILKAKMNKKDIS